MNLIFAFILTISLGYMAFTNPDGATSAMIAGATKAVTLCLALAAIYTVWIGVAEIAEKAGVTGKLAGLLSKPIDLLFSHPSPEIKKYITLNVSANLLGIGGLATPAGIEAARLLGEKGDSKSLDVLFVLAATSLQLLPATVISLRQNYGSASPADIFLPTLLSTLVSTATGLSLLFLSEKIKRGKRR